MDVSLFISWIQEVAGKAKALYILGDLFDYWVGDVVQSDMEKKVIEALAVLSKQGCELLIQRGNRDFLLGDHFSYQTGAQYLNEHYGDRVRETNQYESEWN